MVIYDLACSSGHRFEGWFREADDFHSQQESGLLSCPHCGSAQISKLPTASRIRTDRNRATHSQDESDTAPLQKLQQFIAEHFDDVGSHFPEEARRIHYGETEARDIWGTATAEETRDLLEEGVSVIPLPGVASKKKIN